MPSIQELKLLRDKKRAVQEATRVILTQRETEQAGQIRQGLLNILGTDESIFKDFIEDELWELAEFAEEKNISPKILLNRVRASFVDCKYARLPEGEFLYNEAPEGESAEKIYKKAMVLVHRSVPATPGPFLQVAERLLSQAAEREEEPERKTTYEFLSKHIWLIYRYRKKQFWEHY